MRNKTSLNFQIQNSLFSSSCNFNELNLLFFFTCLICPLFLVSSTIFSFKASQFFASKHIFTMPTRIRLVECVSDA